MNLADLTTVLVFIIGSISPPSYAMSMDAPWWMVGLSTLWGIIFGVVAAFGSGKVAYWLLMDQSKSEGISGIKFIGYMIWPIPAIGLSLLGALWTTSLIIK